MALLKVVVYAVPKEKWLQAKLSNEKLKLVLKEHVRFVSSKCAWDNMWTLDVRLRLDTGLISCIRKLARANHSELIDELVIDPTVQEVPNDRSHT